MSWRRRVLALGILVGAIVAPAAAAWHHGPALAQSAAPSVTLTPPCGPPAQPGGLVLTYSITVTGVNFTYVPPDNVVPIYFAGAGMAPPGELVGRALIDSSGNLAGTTPIRPAAQPPGTYVVTVPNPTKGLVTASFSVPCAPAITVTPNCGPPAPPATAVVQTYAIVVAGTQFSPSADIEILFAGRLVARANADRSGSFSVSTKVAGQPAGTYPVSALDLLAKTAVATTFTVPCIYHPSVILQPPLGRPGFVTTAVGTGFPPNTQVTLSWSQGVPVVFSPVVADASGNFSVVILIFVHDQLGPRQLAARPVVAGAFPEADGPYLVVPGPGQPLGYSVATSLARERH